MSVEHLAIVLHHSKAVGTDKVIMIGIANHDGDLGAYPGVPTLAKYANVAESSAREAVRRLEACPGGEHGPCPEPRKSGACPHLGEIRVDVGAGPLMPNGGRTNRYTILVKCPPECDRTPYHRISKTPKTPTGGPVAVDNSTPTGGPVPPPTGGPVPPPTGGPVGNHPRTIQEPPPTPPTTPALPESVAQLWTGEGISNEDQHALWAAVLADPETNVPAARARQRSWFVPTLARIHASTRTTLAAHVDTIRRFGTTCEHGEPGGADPHPTTGLPLCPLCRAGARDHG